MVSPGLNKKSSETLSLTQNARKIFQAIHREQTKELDSDVARIRVSSLVSKMAFFYEKVRNAVDYDEEHLLRKNAIERILKRQIVIEGVIKPSQSLEISKNLIIELIRAAYLPNNEIPEAKIKEVAQLIEKYIRLKELSVKQISSFFNFKAEMSKMKEEVEERNQVVNWLISLAASEIEENLGQNEKIQAISSSMFSVLSKLIELPADLPYNKDLDIQIYLSIFRKHFNFDQDMLSFVLFKYYNSHWDNPSEDDLKSVAKKIKPLKEAVEKQLKHPLSKQLDAIVRKYSLYFSTLSEVIEENPVLAYNTIKRDHKDFVRLVQRVCSQNYKKIKSKLWRSGVRSIIYIFITKSIFVVLLEVPAIKFFGEEFNPITLGINIIFPAFLLFLFIASTRMPSQKNTDMIVNGIDEIAFVEKARKNPITLRRPIKRGSVISTIFTLLYIATFFFSIYLVIWVLNMINFNWVSMIIFLFFLALISFFSVRVKKGIKEIIIEERRDNLFNFFFDFFYMPVAAIGKWLSNNFSKINIFVFIMDFIIESPFKIFVEATEEWTKYVKEKKEDLI